MTAAAAPESYAEGWRAGRSAARFAVLVAQGEAPPAARGAFDGALGRIDAMAPPPPGIAGSRADRLAAAIAAALALADADLGPEAVAVLRDALA